MSGRIEHGSPTREARRLLACGIVAGPLFLAATLIHAFTRAGFDLGRHPISLLSLGDLGWLQVATFVITGVLYVTCAVGMRRVMGSSRGATWGPRLIGALGVGLIMAGVFVADAGAGFPPGAPSGAPEISWHGALHELGFIVAMLSATAACFVFARRFAGDGRRGWAAACIGAAVAALALSFWPDMEGLSVRLVAATAIQFGLVAAVAARLRADVPSAASAHDRTTGQIGGVA